ncbi:7356_t:CDS:1, partial [Gigaspora rosea]
SLDKNLMGIVLKSTFKTTKIQVNSLMGIALNQHSRQQRFKLTAYADELTIGIASHAE